MFEILRLELRQMLGGKRKWLVVLLLAVPVLLTCMAASVGGLADLEARLEAERRQTARRITGRRVVPTDGPVALADGRLEVTRDGAFFQGRPVSGRLRIRTDGDEITVIDGQVWVNRHLARKIGRRNIRIDRRWVRRNAPPTWETVCAIYLFLMFPQTLCLLLALLYCSTLFGAELERKTLVYLFTRPLPRWRFVVGKYAAIVLTVTPPLGTSVLASWLLMGRPGGADLLAGILAAAGGAILAYGALFTLIGFIIPRRAMVVCLVFGGVVEFVLSFVPALINMLTVTYYLRSLAVDIGRLEVPGELSRVVGGASVTTALAVLAGIVTVGLGASALLASRREYLIADEV